jgi:sulfate permease, SulP family
MIKQLRRELEPQKLLFSLVSGSVIGVMIIMIVISFTTMVFPGEISAYLSTGIGIALVSATTLSVVIPLASSFPDSIGSPQDSPAAIMAVIASSLALYSFGLPEVKFLTIVAVLALTSLLTGMVFLRRCRDGDCGSR